jgi:hypothetical protein
LAREDELVPDDGLVRDDGLDWEDEQVRHACCLLPAIQAKCIILINVFIFNIAFLLLRFSPYLLLTTLHPRLLAI